MIHKNFAENTTRFQNGIISHKNTIKNILLRSVPLPPTSCTTQHENKMKFYSRACALVFPSLPCSVQENQAYPYEYISEDLSVAPLHVKSLVSRVSLHN
jgi:hypothetical protein